MESVKRFVLLVSYFLTTSPVRAAAWDTSCFSKIPGAEDVATIKCLESMFTNVVQAVMALTGVALFIMLVIGGYNFLLSGGDQKKLETARGTLTSAVIGLVVIVTAFLIIKTVQVFTNSTIPVTQFTIPMWK